MTCPNCGKGMETGLMIPYKPCFLEWAPGHWIFPFPRKDRVKLHPAKPLDTPFDFPEYSALICRNCKTIVFQYQ